MQPNSNFDNESGVYDLQTVLQAYPAAEIKPEKPKQLEIKQAELW